MNHAVDTTIRRMAADVVKIAEDHGGLVGPNFAKDLVVLCTSRGKRSRGGVKRINGDLKSFVSINRKKAWWYEPKLESGYGHTWDYGPKTVKRMMETARSTKTALRYHKWLTWLEEGKAVLGEYASIADDPEIGDMTGDHTDTDKVLANVVCHEIAHAIDFENWGKSGSNPDPVVIDGKDWGRMSGGAHGKRWREIYRVLRNAYVATGAYKEEKPMLPRLICANGMMVTKAENRMELLGLPLFEKAA
jgi:hypothetical protein